MIFGGRIDQLPYFLHRQVSRAERNANDWNIRIKRRDVDRGTGNDGTLVVDHFIAQAKADTWIDTLIGDAVENPAMVAGRQGRAVGSRRGGGGRHGRRLEQTARPEQDVGTGTEIHEVRGKCPWSAWLELEIREIDRWPGVACGTRLETGGLEGRGGAGGWRREV